MRRHQGPIPASPSVALLAPGQLDLETTTDERITSAIEDAACHLIKTRKSKNTRDAYERDWNVWRDHVKKRRLHLARPTLLETVAFRDELPDPPKNYGTASISRILATLSFFYRAFMSAGLVAANPFDRAWLPRDAPGKGKTRAVAVDDAFKIIEAVELDTSAKGRRDHALLRLLYDTGTRRSSAATALRENLDLSTHYLRVIVKGNKERMLEFTKECADALTAWLEIAEPSPFIFPSAKRDANTPKSIDLATVNRIVSARAQAVGIAKVHPHRFRASLITDGYSAKVPERDLQTVAHHASAEMTRTYDRGVRGEHTVDQIAAFRRRTRTRP